LLNSRCQFLVSDVFSGYARAAREVNKVRAEERLELILNIYCNAHSRRKFKEADKVLEQLIANAQSDAERASLEAARKEVQFYLSQYRRIYRLDALGKIRLTKKSEIRKRMKKYFVKMTRFLENVDLPIENNPQERLLRNPVIGRKTWYGTHSKLGAQTSAILFSLVESCKLNKVNPREYFKILVAELHQGKPAFTPWEYRQRPPAS
jgi:transposase